MAVLQLAPRDDVFERVQILTHVARVMLDVRIVCGLLVALWLGMGPHRGPVVVGLCLLMAWLLLVLLRWRTIGWVLCTHPVILAADATAGYVVLAVTETVSPVLLLVASGAMLTGLCLDRRGAWYFSPLLAAAWWLVYSLNPPSRVSEGDGFVHVVVVPALLAGAMFLGAGIRRVMLEGAEADRVLREQMRAAGVAEERARLAREMHDSLTKSLHGIAMMADALPAWVERSPERAQQHARTISEQLRSAARESRSVILAMRQTDATATPGDLVCSAVDRWQATTGRSARCSVEGEPVLPAESAYEMAAVLGEALENIRRHTPDSTAASVVLAEEPGWVRLVVGDDGPGFVEEPDDARSPGHFGLIGMQERAARVGGRLTVTSRPGEGTSVELWVPGSVSRDDLVRGGLLPRSMNEVAT